MSRSERLLIIAALVCTALYAPYFLFQTLHGLQGHQPTMLAILPFHFAVMLLNFTALIATLRDLYLRDFAHRNQKVTWALLILFTGGIGWVAYIFKYAFKPR